MIEGGSVILLLLVEDGGAVNDAEEVLWALEELGRGDEEMDVMEEMEVGKIEVDMVVLLVLFWLFWSGSDHETCVGTRRRRRLEAEEAWRVCGPAA